MAKRKAGGQPGNSNARTHGFYAGALSGAGQRLLRRASNIDPQTLEHETALLRARIWELTKKEPGNLNVLVLALRQLTKMVATQFSLSQTEEDGIHNSLLDLIKTVTPDPL